MEVFTCIAYCSDNQTLCAGTNQGNLYTWKRTNYSVDVPENTWQLNNISAVRGAIKQCTWGVCETVKPCIMVNCIANVYILKVRTDTTKLGNYDTQQTENNTKPFNLHNEFMQICFLNYTQISLYKMSLGTTIGVSSLSRNMGNAKKC